MKIDEVIVSRVKNGFIIGLVDVDYNEREPFDTHVFKSSELKELLASLEKWLK